MANGRALAAEPTDAVVISRGRLARYRLLLIVELDVGLVEQRNVEAERETARGGLVERKAGVPAVQIPLQLNDVHAELACVEIVVRIPGRRLVRGGLKREAQRHLPAPARWAHRGDSGERQRVDGLGPRPRPRVAHRQVEPRSRAARRQPAWSGESLLPERRSRW